MHCLYVQTCFFSGLLSRCFLTLIWYFSVWVDSAYGWISNINEYGNLVKKDTINYMAFSIICWFCIQPSTNHNGSTFTEKQLIYTSMNEENSWFYVSLTFVWSSPYMYFACLDNCLHKIAFTGANWVITISAKMSEINWAQSNYETSFAPNTACYYFLK